MILVFAIFFFLMAEGLIDPQVQEATQDYSIFISLLLKAVIALSLRPIEVLLENMLLRTANKPQQELM
jgi:hypothetical protein